MFEIDRWQEIIHTLRSNKLRTFLTAFGVFWGIFMLIVMLGSGNGLENAVYDGLGDFSTNSCFIWSQRTSMPYEGFPRGRYYNFNNEDIRLIREKVPDIELLAPRIQARGGNGENNVVRDEKTGSFSILGDYPEYNLIDPMTILEGRFINPLDIREKRKIAVIGTRVAEVLFNEREEVLNEYIRIQGVYFKVVGIFRSKHNGGWAEEQEQSIFLPFTTLQKTYNYGNTVGYFSITAKENMSVSAVEEQVKQVLKKRHHIHPDDHQAIGSNNVEKQFLRFNRLFLGIAILVWIVGTGTLLAGVIGVSNIMLVIVRERTHEIGIQRALGATPWKIISQILMESVFLTSIAGYFGLMAGVGLVEMIAYLLVKSGTPTDMFKNPGVDFNIALAALVILIVSGTMAGMIPARRAVSIKPIDALRTED